MTAAIIAAAVAIPVCLAVVLLCRRHIARCYDEVEEVLDGVLARREVVPRSDTADTRLSKLVHKAEKIAAVTTVSVEKTRRDRDTIQCLISDLSHQMKTPLAAIALYAELLQDEELPREKRREFLSRMGDNTAKLQWLTDSLVKISRLETGAIALSCHGAALGPTVDAAVHAVSAAAGSKHIVVKTTSFTSISVFHDTKWTGEAIANVLENAVKYSPQHTQITVSVEALPLYTKVNIRDEGCGIAPEEWTAIFKRFYRGKNAAKTEGAGLGLYLTALILEKQGGYLSLIHI